MIVLLLVSLLSPLFSIDIGKINALKKEAEEAFAAGDYQKAAATYQYLADSMGVREDEVLMNLASARFQLSDTAGARTLYRDLTTSRNLKIRSRSHQQLGALSTKQGNLEEAVAEFKQALQADPTNQDARYNYELAARKLAEQRKKEQQQKDQNKDNKDNQDNKDKQDQNKKDQQQKQKDQQNKDKKNQEEQQKSQQEKEKQEQQKKEQEKQQQEQQEKKENEQDQKPKQFDPERMKQMKVSEDKARMILDAMKNNEIQYLQQNKRKPTKPKDKNRPDW